MRSTWWQLAGVGLVFLVSGCSPLPGRAGLSKLGLPSPQATIAADQKKQIAPRSATSKPASTPGKTTARANESAVNDALERGRTHERSGQHDKARKIYETALTQHPQNVTLLHRLGVVADGQNKHSEAEQFFLAALEREPQNADVLGDLGYCYYLQGKLDKAQGALVQAVALAPQSARHHNNLGLVLGHLNDYDGAFAQFQAAGSEADAYYNMAFVFAGQDLNDEAKGCFQEALTADPTHERAKVALASFEEFDRTSTSQGDIDAAVADDGVRYVPYVEGSEAGRGDVQPASATGNLPASRDVGRTTRTLQLKSRGLLSRHMQQQRQTSQPSDANPSAGGLIEVQPQ